MSAPVIDKDQLERARRLCQTAEPHAVEVPCSRHLDEARRQLGPEPRG